MRHTVRRKHWKPSYPERLEHHAIRTNQRIRFYSFFRRQSEPITPNWCWAQWHDRTHYRCVPYTINRSIWTIQTIIPIFRASDRLRRPFKPFRAPIGCGTIDGAILSIYDCSFISSFHHHHILFSLPLTPHESIPVIRWALSHFQVY